MLEPDRSGRRVAEILTESIGEFTFAFRFAMAKLAKRDRIAEACRERARYELMLRPERLLVYSKYLPSLRHDVDLDIA